MNEKERLLAFYWGKKYDKMPLPSVCEGNIYPPSGFHERPPFNGGGRDWFGCKWELMDGASAPAPDVSEHVLSDICNWREEVKFPDLDAWDWERAAEIDKVNEFDRENNVIDLVVTSGLWERMHILMGFENALCSLLEEPEEVEALLDALTEHKIKFIEKIAEYYKIDVITFHDDWGTQTGMFFSPELWRQYIKPRQKRIIDAAHKHGIAFVMHSCGKIDDIIPELPEIGVNCLQLMGGINDIKAAMEKTEGKMSFHVNAHPQDFPNMEQMGILTPEYVRDTVAKEFEEWGATGLYMPFMTWVPRSWADEIMLEEYLKAREKYAGTYL